MPTLTELSDDALLERSSDEILGATIVGSLRRGRARLQLQFMAVVEHYLFKFGSVYE